jgi:hypothetical protein
MDEAAQSIIARFQMQAHPEGGFFREVYRSDIQFEYPGLADGRPRTRSGSTLIYFLLAEQQFSAFHRVVCSDEVWHLYAGGPLELHLIDSEGGYECRQLSTCIDSGEPAAVVKAGDWQAARLAPGARWAFCGCTVAPGFDFDDFEMPPAQTLIASHPQHDAVIRELTRR